MWQLELVQPEWFGAQGPGVESPTFPCSMQVLTPCPVLPLVLGKEPLNESTGGATSKPQDPGARLRTSFRVGWCRDLAGCGVGPGSHPASIASHSLPGNDAQLGQGMASPWSCCPGLSHPHPYPHLCSHSHLLKPPRIQGTHLLPNHLLLSLCGSGSRTCVLAVPGGR